MDLQKLTKTLKNIKSKKELITELKKDPRIILPIRLSLNLSQREFINKIRISQVTLINYEKRKSKSISKRKLENIIKVFLSKKPKINYSKILKIYNKFKDMKEGKLMTSEKARELQKIWQEKTTKKQRSEWGSKGARITNKKTKCTNQEKIIIEILNKNKLDYKTHFDIKTNKLNLNVDFAIFKNNNLSKIIEVTGRKGKMYEYSLSYCYKAILLKERYPSIKLIFIGSDDISESAKILLAKEFNHVLKISEVKNNLHLLQ